MVNGELRAIGAKIVEYALAMPGAYEEFPWGERVAKVNKKVFAFLGKEQQNHDDLSFSVKLPHSNAEALELPFTEPAGYGLGKSGWVAFRIPRGTQVELELLLRFVEESYRAVAPKKLIAKLDTDKQ
jgi:predicted DNA-binding protein (MmcQ/YjbR family)